jgi:Protein of unknown function (DUF1570).
MRKLCVVAAMALLAGAFASAQAAGPATAQAADAKAVGPASPPPAAPLFAASAGEHYSVLSELGQDRADALCTRMEALFTFFEGYFHYDPSELRSKLNVREFADKAGFDAYLIPILGRPSDDFVYLHYPNAERSELLVFSKDEGAFSSSLAHQGFVQFLKAFVPNPPIWLREGLAICFESARWNDKTGKIEASENLAWLETAKSLKERGLFMPLSRLLSLTQEEARADLEVFYPQAWALASFLSSSEDRSYNRLLWDAVAALKHDASLDENQAAVSRIVAAWYGADAVEKGLSAYLAGRKTFAELVASGIRDYTDKAYAKAAESFAAAKAMKAASYVPEYYLGLISYAQKDYFVAEAHFIQARQLGCDAATVDYALGLNAYAQNRPDDAKTYLKAAKDEAPERYAAKADALLAKIK